MGLVWYNNMVALSFFWNTNLAAVTSCENAVHIKLLRTCFKLYIFYIMCTMYHKMYYGLVKNVYTYSKFALFFMLEL